MTYSIDIRKISGQWVSVNTDPEVLELFHTNILPLPFGPDANPAEIAGSLARRNPDHIIKHDGVTIFTATA